MKAWSCQHACVWNENEAAFIVPERRREPRCLEKRSTSYPRPSTDLDYTAGEECQAPGGGALSTEEKDTDGQQASLGTAGSPMPLQQSVSLW